MPQDFRLPVQPQKNLFQHVWHPPCTDKFLGLCHFAKPSLYKCRDHQRSRLNIKHQNSVSGKELLHVTQRLGTKKESCAICSA
jgi:hypothetical protein